MYTTQVNSAFGACLLVRSEVILQLYSPASIERCAKLITFQLITTNKVLFGAIFSNRVLHTYSRIHLGVSESGGYLPQRFAPRQIPTTIHLHLSE